MNATREKRRVAGSAASRSGGPPIAGPGERVVGISRRIWTVLAFLLLIAAAAAFAFFRTQGALDTTRAALKEAQTNLNAAQIALRHANEAKTQAIADREQLVKELSAQGDKLAEFSRGEEKAKTQAAQASTGIEAVRRQNKELKKKLAATEKDITALTAELEVTRAALEQARADVELWRSRAEPYGSSTPSTPGTAN